MVTTKPLSALRQMHPEHAPRIAVRDYQNYPPLNPNGQLRPALVVSDAWLTVGGCLPVWARVSCENREHLLRLECERDLSHEMQCAIADVLRQEENRARRQAYLRGAGRN